MPFHLPIFASDVKLYALLSEAWLAGNILLFFFNHLLISSLTHSSHDQEQWNRLMTELWKWQHISKIWNFGIWRCRCDLQVVSIVAMFTMLWQLICVLGPISTFKFTISTWNRGHWWVTKLRNWSLKSLKLPQINKQEVNNKFYHCACPTMPIENRNAQLKYYDLYSALRGFRADLLNIDYC